MEIRKWTTVDVHYSEKESALASKERQYLEKLGYEFQQTDESGHIGNGIWCDQYIKNGKSRIKFNTQPKNK